MNYLVKLLDPKNISSCNLASFCDRLCRGGGGKLVSQEGENEK